VAQGKLKDDLYDKINVLELYGRRQVSDKVVNILQIGDS
jgi:hypothetical protein